MTIVSRINASKALCAFCFSTSGSSCNGWPSLISGHFISCEFDVCILELLDNIRNWTFYIFSSFTEQPGHLLLLLFPRNFDYRTHFYSRWFKDITLQDRVSKKTKTALEDTPMRTWYELFQDLVVTTDFHCALDRISLGCKTRIKCPQRSLRSRGLWFTEIGVRTIFESGRGNINHDQCFTDTYFNSGVSLCRVEVISF